MGRAHEVRAASMAKTAAMKSKLYSRYGKELFIAAKSGVPDPEMNLALARKIKEAKSNQVPADVIKRAIEKAKGGSQESYAECRYEGFGPGAVTVIVDCLTDNTNRAFTDVRTAFNKSKGCKIAASGAVSFGYQRLGAFSFETTLSEDELLEILIMEDINVTDAHVEDGYAEVYVEASDFAKCQDCLEANVEGVEFDRCEVSMIPDEYITLDNEDDKAALDKLMAMLMDVEDVNKVYTNVKPEAAEEE